MKRIGFIIGLCTIIIACAPATPAQQADGSLPVSSPAVRPYTHLMDNGDTCYTYNGNIACTPAKGK